MRDRTPSETKALIPMKKPYTSPRIQIITMEASQLLANSNEKPSSFELKREVDKNEEYSRKKSIWD